MHPAPVLAGLVAGLALSACAVAPPAGPTIVAIPGHGKSFEAFQQEDAVCRGVATVQTGGASPAQAATAAGVGSAVLGTALGAATGAAIGSAGAAAGAGAAIGGAARLLAGSAIGGASAQASAAGIQQRYDIVYGQCMYAKGNTVQMPPSGPYAYGAPLYFYGPAYYGPAFFGPPIVVGIGGGWGWHSRWRHW